MNWNCGCGEGGGEETLTEQKNAPSDLTFIVFWFFRLFRFSVVTYLVQEFSCPFQLTPTFFRLPIKPELSLITWDNGKCSIEGSLCQVFLYSLSRLFRNVLHFNSLEMSPGNLTPIMSGQRVDPGRCTPSRDDLEEGRISSSVESFVAFAEQPWASGATP